jgi:XRE family transcriptional regulator, regulator of sulfur utilization
MLDLHELGERIQAIRLERGLTLHRLAERSAVSVSMLSAVERAEKAPTVVVLARIAEGLDTPLAGLLGETEPPRVVVRRASEHDAVEYPEGWSREILSPVIPGVNFELVRTTLRPGADPGPYPAYAPGSHEFVLVEEGALTLTLGDETLELAPRDSVYFAADVTHHYRNTTKRPCSYYVAALIMRSRLR